MSTINAHRVKLRLQSNGELERQHAREPTLSAEAHPTEVSLRKG